MKKQPFVLLSALSVAVLLSTLSGGVVQAASAPVASTGALCAKAGATTTVAGKSYTCIKVLSGKLVWSATSPTTASGGAKPQISGGASGESEGPDGGPGGPGKDGINGKNHAARDLGRQTALKKYNACLISHGGVAVAACAALAPKLPPRGDD